MKNRTASSNWKALQALKLHDCVFICRCSCGEYEIGQRDNTFFNVLFKDSNTFILQNYMILTMDWYNDIDIKTIVELYSCLLFITIEI